MTRVPLHLSAAALISGSHPKEFVFYIGRSLSLAVNSAMLSETTRTSGSIGSRSERLRWPADGKIQRRGRWPHPIHRQAQSVHRIVDRLTQAQATVVRGRARSGILTVHLRVQKYGSPAAVVSQSCGAVYAGRLYLSRRPPSTSPFLCAYTTALRLPTSTRHLLSNPSLRCIPLLRPSHRCSARRSGPRIGEHVGGTDPTVWSSATRA